MTASAKTEIQFEILPSQTRMPDAERVRVLEAPGFGQVFTDHMITLRWTEERGWHDQPFSAEVTLPPLSVLWLRPAG